MKKLLRELGLLPSDAITFSEIRRLVNKSDAVIFELGAHTGGDTRRFLRSFRKGQVFAFEPDPRAISTWKKTTRSNRAKLVEVAIGAEDGEISFHQSDGQRDRYKTGWDRSGSIRAPKAHLEDDPDITFENSITVPMRSLDSWCSENGIKQIDFIWADLQGAERDLIKGAQQMLPNVRYLYTEYSNRELYEGQWTLDQIQDALPNHQLLKTWSGDALFGLKTEIKGSA